jgi:hypothetical protein
VLAMLPDSAERYLSTPRKTGVRVERLPAPRP